MLDAEEVELLGGLDSFLRGINWEYKDTRSQMPIQIDYDQAADLGVMVSNTARTLETMLGSRRKMIMLSF